MKNLIHHTNHLTIYAIILLTIGLSLRYIIGKRRFNRRGIAGLQQFRSYKHALMVCFIERLINILGAGCIAAGSALVLIAYFN